jgi:hypothetical protein
MRLPSRRSRESGNPGSYVRQVRCPTSPLQGLRYRRGPVTTKRLGPHHHPTSDSINVSRGIVIVLLTLAYAPAAAAQHVSSLGSGNQLERWSAPALSEGAGLSAMPAAFDSDPEGEAPFIATAGPAVVGSALGLVAGAVVMGYSLDTLGAGSGPGMLGMMGGGLVGSTVGSASAAHHAARHVSVPGQEVPYGRSLLGAVIGVVPGMAGHLVGARTVGFWGGLLGYSLGQGITTALITVR